MSVSWQKPGQGAHPGRKHPAILPHDRSTVWFWQIRPIRVYRAIPPRLLAYRGVGENIPPK